MADFIDSINGFGGSVPTPAPVGLDAGTTGLEHQQTKQAMQDPSYFSGLLNNGVAEQTGSLGQTSQRAKQQAAGLGMPNSNVDAIRGAYQSNAQKGINQVYNQNQYQGQLMKADYMHQMSQVMLGAQSQQVQNYQMLTQAYVAQEMGRAQTINSLFQTGNTAMGMNMANNKRTPTQAPGASGGGEAGMVGGYSPQAPANYGQNYMTS